LAFALSTDNGHRIVVRGDRIADPATEAPRTFTLGGGEILPGLINAHDHLFLNHYPRLGSPPYPNAYAWGRDIHARFAGEIGRLSAFPRREALLFGALKNLLGGVTTVVHHDPWDPTLTQFPVRVARVRVAHSLGFERDFPGAMAGDEVTRERPWSMHLAEGVDAGAAEEVREANARGMLDPQLVAVHAVGADRGGVALLAASGAAVVWCPTSNRFLYGRTAPRELFAAGIDVLLGTDALLTGDGTMLAELREARRLAHLDDQRLRGATGATAARRLGLPEPSLEPGQPADIICVRRPLFDAQPADVALVLIGGLPRLADAPYGELFEHCRVPAEPLEVGGVAKVVASPLATVAARVFDLSPDCRRVLAS
jgi:cytosine/adenosine deaminase-related metal-dependent hydrolase